MTALVVNLFGAPCSGKSTLAHGLMYKLKSAHVNCEMAPEFAKELTWEGRMSALANQYYVLGQQAMRLSRLVDKVDVVVCDSPMLMGLPYTPADYPEAFRESIRWYHNQFRSINFLVMRDKPYNPSGRNQTEEQSDALVPRIVDILDQSKTPFTTVPGNEWGLDTVVRHCIINQGEQP